MYRMGKEEIRAVEQVIKGGRLFRYRGGEGGWCDKFEADLAKKSGVKHVLLNSSGTASLICGLVGIGIRPGDEVIVPAYTFMASALAVTGAGGIPVLADVDESLLLDPRDVERKITRYTKAIMPVHMLGRMCNMDAINRIARKHKLLVVEDACQGVGGLYRGRQAGSLGDVGAFSFNHFKTISCGEGGAVLTDDQSVFDRAMIYHDGGCVFRDHASKIKTPFFAGSNFRVSMIQGAIMCEQLKKLDTIIKTLQARAVVMRKELKQSSAFRLNPLNEEKGDCGNVVAVIFKKIDLAKAFVEKAKAAGHELNRPIDSGRHVYVNWEPIMNKQGAHCKELNPYRWARRKITYTHDMCAKTLDILERTVVIPVPFNKTVAQARAMAKQLIKL